MPGLLSDIKRVIEEYERTAFKNFCLKQKKSRLRLSINRSALHIASVAHVDIFSLHKNVARLGFYLNASWLKVPQSHVLQLSLEWVDREDNKSVRVGLSSSEAEGKRHLVVQSSKETISVDHVCCSSGRVLWVHLLGEFKNFNLQTQTFDTQKYDSYNLQFTEICIIPVCKFLFVSVYCKIPIRNLPTQKSQHYKRLLTSGLPYLIGLFCTDFM